MNLELVKLTLYVSIVVLDEDCDDKEDEYIETFSGSAFFSDFFKKKIS